MSLGASKSLVLLTQKFPFETGEEFLVPELERLEVAFDRVILIPTAVRDFTSQKATGINTSVRIIKNPQTSREIISALFRNPFTFLTLLVRELRNTKWNFKLLKYYVYHIPFALQLKRQILKEIAINSDVVLYSYWMDTNAFASALLKRDYPLIKLVVRSHGGDLYNERQESGEVAFRNSVYHAADSLFFISKNGLNYVSENYPDFIPKLTLHRLGVEDVNDSLKSEPPSYYQIVSCSSLIPLKRVELIAEVLNNSSLPIQWTHFGGNDLGIKTIEAKVSQIRDGLTINWKGNVKNEEVQTFYRSNFIDVLVNLSSTEGIPVSIMEAIAFGIPALANDVGGISEIVNNTTGLLVENGLSAREIAIILDDFLLSGKSRDNDFRNGVRQFWSENFCAEKNHSHMISNLSTYTFNLPQVSG